MAMLARIAATLTGDPRAARVVPPTGITAGLTVFTSAAMALLAVFALVLGLAAGRAADRWTAALAGTATIRIASSGDGSAARTDTVLAVLATTPGVASVRALDPAETQRLLEPWLGPDIPVDSLPVPQLVEVVSAPGGYDAEGLRLRLAAEAPGAVLDDHTRWREPMIAAAVRLRLLGIGSVALVALATAAMVTLAARAALSANGQVIRVLRLVGARDSYIARAFVRRFTLRALAGAAVGTALGVAAVVLIPAAGDGADFLGDIRFSGRDWLLPALIPVLAAAVAFWATRAAAFRTLRKVQ